MLNSRASQGVSEVQAHLINSGFTVSQTLGPISWGRWCKPGRKFPFCSSSSDLTTEKAMIADDNCVRLLKGMMSSDSSLLLSLVSSSSCSVAMLPLYLDTYVLWPAAGRLQPASFPEGFFNVGFMWASLISFACLTLGRCIDRILVWGNHVVTKQTFCSLLLLQQPSSWVLGRSLWWYLQAVPYSRSCPHQLDVCEPLEWRYHLHER